MEHESLNGQVLASGVFRPGSAPPSDYREVKNEAENKRGETYRKRNEGGNQNEASYLDITLCQVSGKPRSCSCADRPEEKEVPGDRTPPLHQGNDN